MKIADISMKTSKRIYFTLSKFIYYKKYSKILLRGKQLQLTNRYSFSD